jgi:NADPH:quinone reductase
VKRVLVDQFGGPEVLNVVDEENPRSAQGEVRVRVLAAGVSFTDAQIRAGTYIGGPKPPFTPGYELGVVEELGPGCERLKEGDRVGVLTVYGADAESVCVPEKYAVEVPEDLDPAEVVSLISGEASERVDGVLGAVNTFTSLLAQVHAAATGAGGSE